MSYFNHVKSHFISVSKRIYTHPLLHHPIALFSIPSLVVCAFLYQYIGTGNKVISGDFDYFAQMYEAFRITVLHYGQFPSWNPWMSGGVPLFVNPQFGLISIQSVLVLLLGTIYGLKIAYVIYALAGFWGMYALGRSLFKATKLRSVLIGFIWVFCGFFSHHGISHFTFALFFLLPWLVYCIYHRQQKRMWLWFGLIESLIALNSIHYAFLLTSFAVALYFALSLFDISITNNRHVKLSFRVSKDDMLFAAKALAVFLVLSTYRIVTTFIYVHNNSTPPRPPEINPTISVLLKALFLPIESVFKVPTHLQWGWGEYSMYIGLGSTVALLICCGSIIITLIKKKASKRLPISNPRILLIVALVGLLGFLLALGHFSRVSPFALLHYLPGFTETRVPSRWLLFTMFSILVLFLSWKRYTLLFNSLLALSAIELFLTFGPPQAIGAGQYSLPSATFASSFNQYDNSSQHLDAASNPDHSYFHTTQENKGQIYSDDSIIDTLDHVYLTSKCGLNVSSNCGFILSGNAEVSYWSPNKIVIRRTNPGPIALNMNVDDGWRVNNKYLYTDFKRIRPERLFTLPDDNQQSYSLRYAPKLSPSWIAWKATQ